MPRTARFAVALTLAAGAAAFVLLREEISPFDLASWRLHLLPATPGPAAHDVYAHFLPIMKAAGRALGNGGRGLLWTPLQNCGQPFAALNGLWYPPHWLPVVAGPDTGLRLLIALTLILGGWFAYLLGRTLDARPAAALAGALVFELGNVTSHLASWTPLVLGPFVWLPAILLGVERLLRAPSARGTVLLAAACGVALLPAWPQLVAFAYQLAALRLAWALVFERPRQPLAASAAIGVGLVGGLLLGAVQVLPELDAMHASVRRFTLSESEILLAIPLRFADIRQNLARGVAYGQPFAVVPTMFAALAFVGAPRRAVPWFYALTGLLFFLLALGPETPLFGAYLALPGGRMFRDPTRFVWVTGACLAILTALGCERLASFGARADRHRGGLVLAPAVTLAALQIVAAGGLRPTDLAGGILALTFIILVAWRPGTLGVAPRATPALVALALIVAPAATGQYLYRSAESLDAHAALFERLRTRMGSDARAYLVTNDMQRTRFGLMQKSGSWFDVATIGDYEPQTARRFAEFLVRLRAGVPMRSLNVFYYPVQGWMPPTFNRNLLDLAAGRYVVADAGDDPVMSVLRPSPFLVDQDESARVYENPSALPRALWVPRANVVSPPSLLLERLALRWMDPWQVALVEDLPPSGFLGTPLGAGSAPGTVTFVRDDPEHLVLAVQAPQRGFLFLADQYDDGWRATIDGAPAPIMRANYVFRLVEVPAGASRVEFRYRPRAVAAGALVSATSLVVALGVLGVSRRRRAGTRAPAGSTA